MRPLWVAVVGAAGRGRTALVVATTALVSGLLLVAVSYLRLGVNGSGSGVSHSDIYARGDAPLLGPIADPGTRGGAIFAVVLIAVPIALLLDQAVRLGSNAQRGRYQALAVAGATRRDLRRWGMVETGVPAVVGAAAGVVVWLLLRLALGTALAREDRGALVPTATGPGWWALLVVAVVAAYGVWVGRRSAAAATRAAAREHRAPKPWGLVVLGLAVVVVVGRLRDLSGAVALAVIALAVLGSMLLTPWLAHVLSRRVARSTGDPAVLLAARRIQSDHGAAARAGAAVGAVGLALGIIGAFVTALFVEDGVSDVGYYLVPAVLAAVLAVIALCVVVLSLSLHSIEATLERRREMSALVACGVPFATLEAANRAEIRMVTVPLTVGAGLLGALAYGLAISSSHLSVLGGLVAVAACWAGVLLAARLVARVNRPWLRAAVSTDNLRTE